MPHRIMIVEARTEEAADAIAGFLSDDSLDNVAVALSVQDIDAEPGSWVVLDEHDEADDLMIAVAARVLVNLLGGPDLTWATDRMAELISLRGSEADDDLDEHIGALTVRIADILAMSALRFVRSTHPLLP